MRSEQGEQLKRFRVYLEKKPKLGGPFIWDNNDGPLPENWQNLDLVGSEAELEAANDLGWQKLADRRSNSSGEGGLEKGAGI